MRSGARRSALVGLALSVPGWSAACGPDVLLRCEPGERAQCVCASGARGTATCSERGTRDACECAARMADAATPAPRPPPPRPAPIVDAAPRDRPVREAGAPRMDAGPTPRPPRAPRDAGSLPMWDGGAVEAPPSLLLVVDTSTSMAAESGDGTNRCGYDRTRANDVKCALRTIFDTGVPIGLGLARFHVTACESTERATGCTTASHSGGRAHGEYASCVAPCATGGVCDDSCWPDLATDAAGAPPSPAHLFDAADVVVPIALENEDAIARWTDTTCAFPDDPELDVSSWTPLAGSLGTALRYYDGRLAARDATLPSPIRDDPYRACRRYAVVLLSDGGETCGGDPAARARDLLATSVDGIAYVVRTYVVAVGLAADTRQRSALDAIAGAGDTLAALPAATEDDVIRALYDIFAREVSQSCR
ncbi:MAG: hypothetical protein IT379_23465 [Deltaproteobacteria bacterium]|nr:hypothetical protein [Deltaproteobacteria bacterium]